MFKPLINQVSQQRYGGARISRVAVPLLALTRAVVNSNLSQLGLFCQLQCRRWRVRTLIHLLLQGQ